MQLIEYEKILICLYFTSLFFVDLQSIDKKWNEMNSSPYSKNVWMSIEWDQQNLRKIVSW